MFKEIQVDQRKIETLNSYLIQTGNRIASEGEVDRVMQLSTELSQGEGWLKPNKLANQIASKWRMFIDNNNVKTIYKILQSQQGNCFALGDCVLPSAIFVAAREMQGLETEIYSYEHAFHPYLFVVEGNKYFQVHFKENKDNQIEGVAIERDEKYYKEEFVQQMWRLPNVLGLLQHTDSVKLNCIIGQIDWLSVDEMRDLIELKEVTLG